MTADEGSPRLDRRRDAFITCADTLFLQQGFERTTLADVVECAGGSLATLYKLFGNKSGLLEAVMEQRVCAKEYRLQELADGGRPPAEVLEVLAQDLHERFLDPGEVALSRVVIAYSLENPDFARRFHGRTMANARRFLTRLFARWQEEGHRLNAPPEMLAKIFLGLLIYDLHTQAISHGATASSPGDLEDKVRFFCIGAGLC
jgi:AcrR family transcriptional regulator